MTLDRFFLSQFRRRLRFVSSEERTKGSLLVVLLDVVAAVPSIPRGVGSARGPADPQPGRLACWLHGRRMGMVVEDSAGDGRRKQTMLLSRCLFRGPLDARPRFHITRKVMNLPITGLTKRAYLARPLPVRLESVLKKKKRDSADGCCCVSRRHHHRFRPAAGVEPGRQADVECLSSPVSPCFLFFHFTMSCPA